jgi:hypothetical protein
MLSANMDPPAISLITDDLNLNLDLPGLATTNLKPAGFQK